MKMLLIFFCCFLTLSAYKQQTRENEISDSCGQTYTYIKYRQKVNGYDVSVKFLKDFEAEESNIITKEAVLSFKKDNEELTIVNPCYSDKNYIANGDSVKDALIDYISFKLAENNTFSGNESPFFFFDIDFDGERELIVCLRDGMAYHGHHAYKAYKTKVKNGSYPLSPMQVEPFNALDNYTVFDTINKTISIPLGIGLKMGGWKVYGLTETHSFELKELIKYDWTHTEGIKYEPCDPTVYHYNIIDGVKKLDRIEKCSKDN